MWPRALHFGLCTLLASCQGCVDETHPVPTVRIPRVVTVPTDEEQIPTSTKGRIIQAPDEECLDRGRREKLHSFAASFPTLDLKSGMFYGTDLSILAINEWDRDDPVRVGRIVGRLRIILPSPTVKKLLHELRVLTWSLKNGRFMSSPIVFLIGSHGPQFAPMPEEGTLDDALPYPRTDGGAPDDQLLSLREFASYPVLKRTPLLRSMAETIAAEGKVAEAPGQYTGLVTLIVTAVELWRDGENLGCAPRDE